LIDRDRHAAVPAILHDVLTSCWKPRASTHRTVPFFLGYAIAVCAYDRSAVVIQFIYGWNQICGRC